MLWQLKVEYVVQVYKKRGETVGATTITVAEGVHLHVIPMEKFKTVSAAVLIRQPLARETATKTALIPHILQRGSAKYPTITDVCAKTETLYGSVFDIQTVKKGEQQMIQFVMEFLNEQNAGAGLLDACFDFLAEMMTRPLVCDGGFDKAYTESEKENLGHSIDSRMNNKGEYAKGRLLEIMCKNEPFGVYGDGNKEDLPALNEKNTYAHYAHKLETAPIDFIVLGNVDEAMLENSIKQRFDFQRGPVADLPLPVPLYAPREGRLVEEEMGLTQGKICMGLRSGIDPTGDDFYRLLFMNEVFGGGANGKLFRNIREKESLCYYVHSFVYRFKGIMLVQSGVDAANFTRVRELIEHELDQVKTGKISDAEMDSARKSLIKKYSAVKDYPGSFMDFYLSQHMLNEKIDLDDAIAKIERVNKQDVQESAARLYVDTVYCLR